MRTNSFAPWLVALVWVLPLTAQAQPAQLPTWPVTLQTEVVRLSKAFNGELAFYVKDVPSGVVYSYNGATPFYLASVIKVIVLRELYRQVEDGHVTMEEMVEFTDDSVRDGAGDVKRAQPGTKFSIDDLATHMISQSDNAATDLLIDRLGLDAVNRSVNGLKPYGFGPITTLLDVRRNVYSRLSPKAIDLTPAQVFDLWGSPSMEQRAKMLARMLGENSQRWGAKELEKAFAGYYADLYNSGTMEAVSRLLESILQCEGMTRASCSAMMDKLKKCETGGGRLRASWPQDLVFAHKTGTQHRRVCDVGILFLTDERPVLISACVKDFSKRESAEALLANLGRATYEVLTGKATSRASARTAVAPRPSPPSGGEGR